MDNETEKVLNYENVTEKNHDVYYNIFYAVMCRRWDILCELVENKKWTEIKDITFNNTDITIEKCFAKNMQFLKSSNNINYYERLVDNFDTGFVNIQSDRNTDYDSKDFYKDNNNKRYSVLDIFFGGNQPILDVKYFEKQELASKQLMNNYATIVLDEVGTGKTVSALYAIQKIIQFNIDNDIENAKILIISPYNKREDWSNDIYRQLGRKTTVVNKSDNGKIVKLKSIGEDKPYILIMGCNGGRGDDNNNELKSSLKEYREDVKWDLVIIDECHNCFDNYFDIKAEKVMLLTATPIVPKANINESLDFNGYKELIMNILKVSQYNDSYKYYMLKDRDIDPINCANPTENDIFVCNFKEDIFDVEIERKITFIECERDTRRNEWFNKLRYSKENNFFAAIYADQDDYILAQKMKDTFKDSLENYEVDKNSKLDKLADIVSGKKSNEYDYSSYKHKSIIIFCNITKTVDIIYDKLSNLNLENTLMGKKYGKNSEIKNITQNGEIVIEKLKSFIKEKPENRAILIITGKSGATGLNMGEFDTVINYELPFTSNELEQRFGRIERANDLLDVKEEENEKTPVIQNEMIFLLNKAVDGENDFITNRMLYYSVNKIDKTCRCMPVRNTILFHPEYTKRVEDKARAVFEEYSNFIKSDEGRNQLKKFISYKKEEQKVKSIISDIEKNLSVKERLKNKTIKKKIEIIFNNISVDSIESLDDCYKKTLQSFQAEDNSEYINFEDILDKVLEYYIWLKKTFKLWGFYTLEDNELQDLNIDSYNEEQKKIYYHNKTDHLFKSISSLKSRIIEREEELINICDEILKLVNLYHCTQNAAGIYYVKDNKLINESVKEFRHAKSNN